MTTIDTGNNTTAKKNPRHLRQESYQRALSDARTDLSPTQRLGSRLIHAPGVDTIADFLAKTIMRPRAILFGATLAFVVLLVIYTTARHNGYLVQGSEVLIAFAIGWALGIMYDFFYIMITGKR